MQQQILFNNKKLSYQVLGQGPSLLFVHGFCEDSRMWEAFIENFKSAYQIILVDLPGFGQSEAQERINIEMMADAVQQVLRTLAIQQVVWVGHSMGAYVGLAFAKKYPQFLSGLCIFHAHPFADTDEKRQNRRKSMAFIEKHGAPKFVEELIPMLFSPSFRLLQKPLVNSFISMAKEQSELGILSATQAMIDRPDQQESLRQIHCPVFSILGAEDQVVPQDLSWVSSPPQAAAIILEQVGHMGFLEAPEVCAAALAAWLEGLELSPKAPLN